MGSDMHMNPPQKKWETHRVGTEEEALEWVIGAMANHFEVRVESVNRGAGWLISIFKGVWI